MGAATSLFFAAKHSHRITGVIADSPYACLKELALQQANEKYKLLPEFLLKSFLKVVQSRIKESIGADIFTLSPREQVRYVRCPIFLAVGRQDELTRPEDVKSIFNSIGESKGLSKFYQFEGGHCSIRPPQFFTEAIDFIQSIVLRHLQFRSKSQTAKSPKPKQVMASITLEGFGKHDASTTQTSGHKVSSGSIFRSQTFNLSKENDDPRVSRVLIDITRGPPLENSSRLSKPIFEGLSRRSSIDQNSASRSRNNSQKHSESRATGVSKDTRERSVSGRSTPVSSPMMSNQKKRFPGTLGISSRHPSGIFG
eukprot:TRINITY_DN2914_c0_g2_i1.p1 TRINITY_DN2914_c0_g2~~TRINITY_DN2914_c0_g2_i1.p1  ORF type:complete len:311 (+),score=12.25 TRINITY_DN2914_c0_g2_i1:598-1530(+)